MKRTILFSTALATAAGMFAMGAAQASGKAPAPLCRFDPQETRQFRPNGQ